MDGHYAASLPDAGASACSIPVERSLSGRWCKWFDSGRRYQWIIDYMPFKQCRSEHAAARQVQRRVGRQLWIEPAPGIFAADSDGASVVDIDHAAHAVGRDQHETGFFTVV